MRRGAVSALISAVTCFASACATAPSETAPPEQAAVQVLADVCLPHIADGEAFETVRRRLDYGWSQDWPELLSSPAPGPVFRQPFGPARGVLTFVTERVNPPYGQPRHAGCQMTMRGATAPALIVAVAGVLADRDAHRQSDLRGYIVSSHCVVGTGGRTASVWVLDYGDGRTGVAVNATGGPCP